ncbi:MAG: penicillin-binding protein activator LpoB [Gammaproteobacteria bacterium]|nr:penicillin-binding protein activator LpoB [Gammaproteobacteria bacterium]MDH5730073.1 penicillin-binding protein activator LpoB [Gammaproteobacteria bacterium]
MKALITKLLPVLLVSGLVVGCGGTKVERIGVDEVRDLSGKWNDTDSQLVSKEMIGDVLNRPWLTRFETKNGKPPAVIVGTIRNKSHEHINVTTFVSDMERELINSGLVEFVASKKERGEIREERKDMDTHASEDTRKAMGEEKGADFMLKGTISTIIDAEGKRQVRYYQIDLTLISLADNRKVWVGQKKIKKFLKNANVRG